MSTLTRLLKFMTFTDMLTNPNPWTFLRFFSYTWSALAGIATILAVTVIGTLLTHWLWPTPEHHVTYIQKLPGWLIGGYAALLGFRAYWVAEYHFKPGCRDGWRIRVTRRIVEREAQWRMNHAH